MNIMAVIIQFNLLLALLAVFPSSTTSLDLYSSQVDTAWESFKVQFGLLPNVAYKLESGGETDDIRKKQFAKAHKGIIEHNKNQSHAYQLGHNQFSILTKNEMQKHLGYRGANKQERMAIMLDRDSSYDHLRQKRVSVPSSLDYRTSPCLAPIKNQGGCGSCYVFGAIAPLEFSSCRLKNSTKAFTALSEQQAVDCDTYDGGCGGGWPYNVWRYIKEKNGVDTAASYPYVSGTTRRKGACKFNPKTVGAKVATYGQLPEKNPKAMMEALVKYGPLMVGVAVAGNFAQYRSGVYNDASCDKADRNHAVNIVGFGNDPATKMDYWVLRNSWGTTWGQGGYMLIQRGVNKCHMEEDVGYVVAAK